MKISWGYARCLTLPTARHSAVPELCGSQQAGTVVKQGDAFNVFTHKRSGAIPRDFHIFGLLWKPSNSRRATTCKRLRHSGLRNRLWNSLHTRYGGLCINGDSCINACCDFLSRNSCTREHPQMGINYTCLTFLETTCMQRCIQTETLHPEIKLHLLGRKVNKKRRVNFTSIESLHFYN